MKSIEEAFERLMETSASDLLLSCGSPPRIRKDGQLELLDADAPALTPAESERLLKEIIEPDDWELLQKQRQVDFAFTWRDRARIRANAYFQRDSLAAAFRLLPLAIPGFELLGMPESVHRLLERRQGLILVTGPTGSGKSTSQAAMVDLLNKTRPYHIITFEDPIEYIHKHQLSIVDQRQVGDDTPTFAEGLRSAFREDPDVILIGEMRDLDTISTALTIAETGHLVLATLHTNDAPSAVARLVDIGVQPFLVASSVRAIMAQRLVRRLCPNCKRAGELRETELRALNLESSQLSETQVMTPVGCEQCRNAGYKGRMGIFEIFTIDDDVRHMINNRRSTLLLRQRARGLGMRTLREDGLRKVLAGLTSAEEVISITLGDVS